MFHQVSLSYGFLAMIISAIPASAFSKPSGPGPEACTNLTQSLGAKTVVTNVLSPDYTKALNSYFNTEQSKYKPSCVVYPTSADDVSVAIKAIRESDSRFAIKAGGHNPNDFYSSVDKGVLIDLSSMTEKSYDEESTLATYQPGGTFGDVYDYFAQWNRTVVGARLAGVGTGLALSGGLSYLSSQYGLACDSFRELEVVLPSGEIVAASEDTNPDLFYALRGGGGNAYGVVTKYTVQSHPVDTFYAGIVVYLFEQNSDVLNAISNFIQYNEDPKAAIIGTYMKLPTPDLELNLDEAVTMFLVYDGEDAGGVFKNFTDIPHLANTLGQTDYNGVVNMPIPGSAELNKGRNTFRVTVHGGDQKGIANLNELYEKWRAWSDKNKGKYVLTSFDIQPIPKSLTDASNANFGGNAMQMPDGPWYWVNYLLTASPLLSDEDLDEVQASYKELVEAVPPTEGLPLFINDASHDQNPLVTYGGYEKLKSIKARYDSDGFFIKLDEFLGSNNPNRVQYRLLEQFVVAETGLTTEELERPNNASSEVTKIVSYNDQTSLPIGAPSIQASRDLANFEQRHDCCSAAEHCSPGDYCFHHGGEVRCCPEGLACFEISGVVCFEQAFVWYEEVHIVEEDMDEATTSWDLQESVWGTSTRLSVTASYPTEGRSSYSSLSASVVQAAATSLSLVNAMDARTVTRDPVAHRDFLKSDLEASSYSEDERNGHQNPHEPKRRVFGGFVFTTPNSSRFAHHVHSRILQKFPFLVEMFYWILNYAFYSCTKFVSQSLSPAGTDVVQRAQDHGIDVLNLEHKSMFSIFYPIQEADFQAFFLNGHPGWMTLFNRIYSLVHIPGTVAFISWYYWAAPDFERFATVRRTMTLGNFVAFMVFCFYPCMPPRLLPESYNFHDTVRQENAESVRNVLCGHVLPPQSSLADSPPGRGHVPLGNPIGKAGADDREPTSQHQPIGQGR
ncbi:hypothetical protein BDW62DRAFT_209913 [Aspergillus aurantiobrunneus]